MAQHSAEHVARRIEELQQYIRTVEHVKKLVAELESNRAGKPAVINTICASLARELATLRQRTMTANVGALPDVAGSLAVVAGRGGAGLNMKIRALHDGVNSMMMQLDQSLKTARDQKPPDKKPAR